MATKPIVTGARMSIAEFLDLPDTEERNKMELDDGELYIMPRPRFVHQFLVMRIALYISNYLDSIAEPPASVHIDPVTVFSREPGYVLVPDLTVILSERPGQIVGGYLEGVPDITMEVLSTNRSRDLDRKRSIYADAGVSEYWIFDPENDTALLLELRDGEYVSRVFLTADDTLTTPLLPGLTIPLAELFHHRQRPTDA